jgi:arylamine N-acetyltransferase
MENKLFSDYLKILNVSIKKPSMNALSELIKSHLFNIPFENISKLYYKKLFDLHYIPDFELYIEGIKKYNFGGTCYSNNYYFNKLLKHLKYEIILCGADMKNADSHIVSIVKLDDQEYIVDVGYAAPFLSPIPRDLATEYQINFGEDKYILSPKDENGFSKLNYYKGGSLKHGYTVKPFCRKIKDFDEVIKSSFNPDSTFMNSILLVKYGKDSSKIIHNLSRTDIKNKKYINRILTGENELMNEIEKVFKIPKEIVRESISQISRYEDAWN